MRLVRDLSLRIKAGVVKHPHPKHRGGCSSQHPLLFFLGWFRRIAPAAFLEVERELGKTNSPSQPNLLKAIGYLVVRILGYNSFSLVLRACSVECRYR